MALLLAAMISLSVTDIILRNLFDSGFPLGQQLVRVLVLWLGLLGALYATRYSKHISVDVLTRYLSPRAKAISSGLTSLFACLVCALIAWHSYLFVRDSRSYNDVLFNEIPAWAVQAIIPLGFSLICVRFLAHTFGWLFVSGYNGNKPEEKGKQSL